MATLTIAEKIAIAEINEYLISVAILKGGLYAGGIDVELPTKIRVVRESIENKYNSDPSETTLVQTSNYMLGLCLYVAQAKNITGNGGTIAGIHPIGNPPNPYDFIVSGSSFIATGETTKIITAFIGYNIEFTRGSLTQYTTDPGDGSTYYSWDKNTGVFILSVAAGEEERFRIVPF